MALLLDTREVQPEARHDAVHDAYALAGVPRQVDLTTPLAADATRVEGRMFGSIVLFTPSSPGLRVLRDSPSGQLEPMIALCIRRQGTGRSLEADRREVLLPGELLMVGPTARNDFHIAGVTVALEIPFDEMGVTVELVRRASTRLAASPSTRWSVSIFLRCVPTRTPWRRARRRQRSGPPRHSS
jgi:hypothetical protein